MLVFYFSYVYNSFSLLCQFGTHHNKDNFVRLSEQAFSHEKKWMDERNVL